MENITNIKSMKNEAIQEHKIGKGRKDYLYKIAKMK